MASSLWMAQFYLLRWGLLGLAVGHWVPTWDAHAELTSMVVACHCQSICLLAHIFSTLCFPVSVPTESPRCSLCPALPMLCCSRASLQFPKTVVLWGGDLDSSRALPGEFKESLWCLMILSSWLLGYALLKVVQENYKALFKLGIPWKMREEEEKRKNKYSLLQNGIINKPPVFCISNSVLCLMSPWKQTMWWAGSQHQQIYSRGSDAHSRDFMCFFNAFLQEKKYC